MFERSPSLKPRAAEHVERREHVVEEVEVVRVLPGARHLDRAAVRVADAAHALDDALCEAHPDLLVVVELGMAMEVGERRPARVVVPGRVELEAVPLAERR